MKRVNILFAVFSLLSALLFSISTISHAQEPLLGAEISGDEVLQIPFIGEAIYQFAITGGNSSAYNFISDNFPNGISLSENGLLTLQEGTEEGTFTVQAKNKEGLLLEKEVTLYPHWRTNEGVIDNFKEPSELTNIVYPLMNLKSSKIIFCIRIGGMVIALGGLLSFAVSYWVHKHRMKKKEER